MQYLKSLGSALEVTIDSVSGSEIERKVKSATADAGGYASSTELYQIAAATANWPDYEQISAVLWPRIQAPPDKWRQVHKCLILLDFIIRYGHHRVIDDVTELRHQTILRRLREFEYHDKTDSRQSDKGALIKERAAHLLTLCTDTDALRRVRAEAEANRDKYVGLSADTRRGSFSEDPSRMTDSAPIGRRWSAADMLGPPTIRDRERRSSDASQRYDDTNNRNAGDFTPDYLRTTHASMTQAPPPPQPQPHKPMPHPRPPNRSPQLQAHSQPQSQAKTPASAPAPPVDLLNLSAFNTQ